MNSPWEKGICNETSGFLFSHPCDRMSVAECGQCERPVCNDHAHVTDAAGATLCTSCVKKSRKINRRHQRQRGYHDSDFYDDPYFYGPRYGGYWYRSHHHVHDVHDFTEADAESLHDAGDFEFENDMTES